MTRRKFEKDKKESKNPDFIPKCHPESRVDYAIIWADTLPQSKAIAVIGRCHACGGIQVQNFKVAPNIVPMELAKRFHCNSRTLLLEEDIPSILSDKSKPIGEIHDPVIPRETITDVQPPKHKTHSAPEDLSGGSMQPESVSLEEEDVPF